MYNKNYYPTPDNIIAQMIEPYREEIKNATILEPSAGMGAILNKLYFAGAKKEKMYAIEIDDNFQATLKGRGYKVIHNDFLTYSGAMNFDMIIMNPPFDRGAEHLLRAWEILRGGKIVCLLNEETINNPHSENRRDLAKLIEKHGTVEYLGNAFGDADRKTQVGVVMVRLEKVAAQSGVKFDMKGSAPIEDIDMSSKASGVEKRDYVGALVRSYQMALNTSEALYKAMQDFRLYTSVFASQYDVPKMLAAFYETSQKQGFSSAHNEFVMSLQGKAWDTIFNKTKASNLATKKAKDKFHQWREEQKGVDLNEENIWLLLEALVSQRGQIVSECIEDVFDRLTQYSEKNRSTIGGDRYKTNSAYTVCKKFILNYIVETGWSNGLSLNHRVYDLLDDIDRAMCMISGKPFSVEPIPGLPAEEQPKGIVKLKDAIMNWCRDLSVPAESEFFTFQCYKKGSAHFTFKDETLLNEFNRRACAAKGWQLPEAETFKGKARRGQR